jgi:hypothetical protein
MIPKPHFGFFSKGLSKDEMSVEGQAVDPTRYSYL